MKSEEDGTVGPQSRAPHESIADLIPTTPDRTITDLPILRFLLPGIILLALLAGAALGPEWRDLEAIGTGLLAVGTAYQTVRGLEDGYAAAWMEAHEELRTRMKEQERRRDQGVGVTRADLNEVVRQPVREVARKRAGVAFRDAIGWAVMLAGAGFLAVVARLNGAA